MIFWKACFFIYLIMLSSASDIHGVVSYKKCPDHSQLFLGRMRGDWEEQ